MVVHGIVLDEEPVDDASIVYSGFLEFVIGRLNRGAYFEFEPDLAMWLLARAEEYEYALVLTLVGDDADDDSYIDALLAKRIGKAWDVEIAMLVEVNVNMSAGWPEYSVAVEKVYVHELEEKYRGFVKRVLKRYREKCSGHCSRTAMRMLELDEQVAREFLEALSAGKDYRFKKVWW